MTQPKLPLRELDIPGSFLQVLENNPFGSSTAKEKEAYAQLWSKLRWAVGTTYGCTYTKSSRAGELSRRMALAIVGTNGLPQL